jgi:hypothetical protein
MRGRWLLLSLSLYRLPRATATRQRECRTGMRSSRRAGGREPRHGLPGGHAIEKNSLALVGNARKIPPGRRRSTSWSSRLGSRARLIDRSMQ